MPTTDQLESVRVLLGFGIVLANVAVWYGVYLERDTFPTETKERGWRILIRGLAAEAALAFTLLAVDTTIGVRQRWEIAKLTTDATGLQMRVKDLEPRQFNRAAFISALTNVPRTPVEILYTPDDYDSMLLAQQIELAILAAGWEHPSREPIVKPLDWTGSLPMVVDGAPAGVSVVGNFGLPSAVTDGWLMAIGSAVGKAVLHIGGPHAPPPGAIRVVVAPRA